jgi:hypothetical protein
VVINKPKPYCFSPPAEPFVLAVRGGGEAALSVGDSEIRVKFRSGGLRVFRVLTPFGALKHEVDPSELDLDTLAGGRRVLAALTNLGGPLRSSAEIVL